MATKKNFTIMGCTNRPVQNIYSGNKRSPRGFFFVLTLKGTDLLQIGSPGCISPASKVI
jgi:hypothetical protein